ncbi:hypothetical protein SAMN05192533_101439 [Mesobacillus persicus]|uniref:DoxX protein n=1 Tax=Mesobacillus persicus TaxID=930146 RepID=A0A1H7WIY4_9BACI|nr:hypothetical protein [Mesobacillus persicus]SEM21304.1 hypothetical protein SAMN05192533_101439 [Mesobacillus persicus]
MKKLLPLGILLGVMMTPIFTNAHVKWFTEVTPVKESIENILSPLFMSLALIAAVVLGILTLLIPKMAKWKQIQKWDTQLSGFRKYSKFLLKYGTAIALFIQVVNGTIFAPELPITHTLAIVLAWIAIGLLLIPHHLATKFGAVLLLCLFVYVTFDHGIFYMLDYGFYIAIIGVLLVEKTKLENVGFPFLYLGTGLSLCWVAVEKWVYPSMALDIVVNHQVPTFGFAPAIFIVMAAYIEFIVGYLLVVGILNRVLGIVVTVIFVMTTMLFGMTEVIGHFMVHVVLIIFIIEGVSFYNPPIKMHKTKTDQFIFVFLNFIFVLATFVLIYYRFA